MVIAFIYGMKKIITKNRKGRKMKVIKINDVIIIVSKNDRVLGKVVDGKFDYKRQDPLVVRTFQNLLDMSKSFGYPSYEVIESE